MQRKAMSICLLIFSFFGCFVSSSEAAKKKILYVDSYHQEYAWSAGITAGITSVLSVRDDVELKIFRMDTKRHQSEDFKKQAALKAKKIIDSWHPDLVITSDDNAAKYLIVPYYKGKDLPFVFCGLNWDASEYGFPAKNVTGMVEIQLVDQIIGTMKKYSHGDKIAFLKGDDLSARKEARLIENKFHVHLKKRFVRNFAQWQEEYLRLQDESDMIIIGNVASIPGWNEDKAAQVIMAVTKIPTGNWDSWMAPYALITYATRPDEQGEYAANTALDILAGKSISEIPVVMNKKATVYLNMRLAKKIGVKFPIELLENAHLISAAQKKLLFVNSYYKGYGWSDGIEEGLLKALHITAKTDGTFDTSSSQVVLKVFRMGTKLNGSENFKKQAGRSAKAIIEEWQPDIVVTSDDNAVKYLLEPFYKDSPIPFVYCGVNWDASMYHLPTNNITGMVEVAPALETIALLKKFAKGDRLGFIGSNNLSEHKNIENFRKQLGIVFTDGKLVDDFGQWQTEYLRLQKKVDMILWFNPIGIKGWDEKLAWKFILANSKIPTGGTSDNHIHLALLGMVKIAAEQGWWAGKTALRIINGESPTDIPPVTNTQTRLYLNMELAKSMGIKLPMDLIEKATFVENKRD